MISSKRRNLILLSTISLFILIYPFIFTRAFYQHIMIMVFMYGLLAISWDVIGGYVNLFSFGQSAFFGIGAYTSTVMFLRWGINPWLGMLIGGCVSAMIGLFVSYPTSKLRGHYFAIATLAFLFVIQILLENWKFVGGAQGLTLPILQQSSIWKFQFPESKIPYYYIILILLVLGILITRAVINSKIGYYLRALRESPEVAQSLGINTAKYRLIAIALSAFLSALAGTFYAQYVLYIDPSSVISLALSVEVVLISVFGGYGTIYGPLLGTVILVPMTNLIRASLGGAGRGIAYMVFGGIIIIICLLQPDGMIKLFKHSKVSIERGT
jgi:branched-chain amino acid transport system permease protein